MKARRTRSFVLAVALTATTAGVYPAQEFDQVSVLGKTVPVAHIASRGSTVDCKVNMTREDSLTTVSTMTRRWKSS
jgi:hypothetical protein